MKDNVIRDQKGRFKPGASGNASGVSAQLAAIKQMQRENEVVMTSNISALVGGAVRLHRALLKDGNKLTTKEAIHLIELTYKFGIGTPRQVDPNLRQEITDNPVDEMSPAKIEAMIELLQNAQKDAFTE